MITKEAVLNKMIQEIQLAQEDLQNEKAFIDHVKNVHLLSELILESRVGTEGHLMHGKMSEQQKVDTVQPITISQTDNIVTEDDGTSIFDF